jgi:hypothetical protein
MFQLVLHNKANWYFVFRAFSDVENTENKPPRKKSRLTVLSESEDEIVVQFQSSSR